MKIKIIQTTTDCYKIAQSIAEILINYQLSPCVQIHPQINSIFEWNNTIKNSKEILINIKTQPKNLQHCKNILLKHHNYDTPEIIVSDWKIIDKTYEKWFTENSRQL